MVEVQMPPCVTNEIISPVGKSVLIEKAGESAISADRLHLIYSLLQGKYTPADVAYMATFPTRFICREQ